MYKEFRFVDPEKAIKKRKELKDTYGYNFEVYKIQLPVNNENGTVYKEFLSIVHPYGLVPNPKKRR